VPSVKWLAKALEDVDRLYDFLSEKNPTAARDAVRAIIASARQLETFPEIGKPLNENPPWRELFSPFGHGAYVLRYRIDRSGNVIITRVWHSRENRWKNRDPGSSV